MKRFVLMTVLAALVAGGVWAQSGPKNMISGDIGLISAGVRYERMLTSKLSIGGTAFYNNFMFFFNSVGVTATGRFYPWAGVFYLGLGLGYGSNFVVNGVMVAPALGWKIDTGKPGAFFINPELSLPIVFGWDGEGEFTNLAIPRASFGIGYAF